MTLTQLRYVITIADTGSMNEASKALFVSAAKFVCRQSKSWRQRLE